MQDTMMVYSDANQTEFSGTAFLDADDSVQHSVGDSTAFAGLKGGVDKGTGVTRLWLFAWVRDQIGFTTGTDLTVTLEQDEDDAWTGETPLLVSPVFTLTGNDDGDIVCVIPVPPITLPFTRVRYDIDTGTLDSGRMGAELTANPRGLAWHDLA